MPLLSFGSSTLYHKKKSLSTAEKQCEDHFAQTHTIDKSGRFAVRILFCNDPNVIGESHHIALNRFLSLEKRLAMAPEIRAQYVKVMKEYETLGHMSPIDINATLSPHYFISHHCILKPDSTTAK